MQPHILLALDVIKDEFGPLCFEMADALIALGQSSVQELSRYVHSRRHLSAGTGPIVSKVRAALLVLLTHDLVAVSMSMRAYIGGDGGAFGSSAPAPTPSIGRGGAGARGGRGAARNTRRGKLAGVIQAAASRILSANLPATSELQVQDAEFGGLRYEFRPLAAVRRLRFPKYLEAVREIGGSDAMNCARVLLQHGPWFKAKVVAEAARVTDSANYDGAMSSTLGGPLVGAGSKRKRPEDVGAHDAAGNGVDSMAEIRAAAGWHALEAAGLVVHATGLSVAFPALLLSSTLPGGIKTGEAGAGIRSGLVIRGKATSGTTASAKAAAPVKKRSRLVVDDEGEDSQLSVASGGGAGADGSLWRFAWEAGDRLVRNGIVARYASEGPGRHLLPGAGSIISGALRVAGVGKEIGTRAHASANVTVREITREVRRSVPEESGSSASGVVSNSRAASWDEGATTDAAVDAICSKLSELPHRVMVLRSRGGSGLPQENVYAVQYSQVAMGAQLRAIGTLVDARYGGLVSAGPSASSGSGLGHSSGSSSSNPAGKDTPASNVNGPEVSRVLRLLLERGALDEKAISDAAMLESKMARSIAFRLVTDGLISLREVPRRPDRAPQHTVFLFQATWDRILPILAEWASASLLRMRIRVRQERVRIAECEETGDLPSGPTRTEWDDSGIFLPRDKEGRVVEAARPVSIVVGAVSGGSVHASASAPALGNEVDGTSACAPIERAYLGVRKLLGACSRVEETLFLFSEL